jgi:hypothetical protein
METEGSSQPDAATRQTDKMKSYSSVQLAKLKGFCGVQMDRDIPEIWDYLKTTNDFDPHCTKLLKSMADWACTQYISITSGIYFDKTTMDEITKQEFNPGAATSFFTAEKGISILIIHPQHGNETADIHSREQALLLTEHNHTLSDTLSLTKKDPRPPAGNYLELLRDVRSFCALV